MVELAIIPLALFSSILIFRREGMLRWLIWGLALAFSLYGFFLYFQMNDIHFTRGDTVYFNGKKGDLASSLALMSVPIFTLLAYLVLGQIKIKRSFILHSLIAVLISLGGCGVYYLTLLVIKDQNWGTGACNIKRNEISGELYCDD